QPTWTPDGKAILYLRYLPLEDNPRPRSLFGGPALCDLRKVSLDQGAKAETLRPPGFLKSVFFLSGERPAWTVVEQGAGGGGFMAPSTTHVETVTGKDGKVVRVRSADGDLGCVAGSAKGDGLYYRAPQVRFLALTDGAAPPMSKPGLGAGFGAG